MGPGGSFGRNCGSLAAVFVLASLALTAACVLTVEDERRLGEQFSRQVQLQKRIVSDPVVVAYVREMGTRLGRAAGPQPFPLTFNVIEDNSVNAFAGPGGYIYVNTGLVLKARNASELAAVMAHEISHVTLRHVSKAVARQQQSAGLGALVAVVTDDPSLGEIAGTGVSVYNLRYDRQAEAAADRSGVILMQRSGYDPHSMITMFQLLQAQGGGSGGFLSSHPGTGERIAAIQGYIRELPPGTGLIRNDGRFAGVQARIRSTSGGSGASGVSPFGSTGKRRY